MVFWKQVAQRYAEAQVVFPWSDIANFVIVDRRLASVVHHGAQAAVRSAKWSGAEEASLSGDTILIYTGGDGGWKVLVRLNTAPPVDIPDGHYIVCPLNAPTGELVIHCGSYAYGLPGVVDADDALFDPDKHAARNDDLGGEPVIATVPAGRYVARVTLTMLDDDYDAELSPDERIPDYLIDLWPQEADPAARFHWKRLG